MSYTVSGNNNNRQNDNTEFRAWGSWISAGIANCGLIQVTDANQINWSTAAVPSAGGDMAGFEVWRFNDALQNTAPVYLKLSYGAGPTANTPGMQWSVGSGYEPNLGGIVSTLTGFLCRDAQGANSFVLAPTVGLFANNTLVSYLSGGNNWVVWAMRARGTGSINNYLQLFSIERTVDANGNPTADGVLITYKNGTTPTIGQAVWNPTLGMISHSNTTAASSGLGMLTPERGGGTTGSNTSIYPIFHDWHGGSFLNPGLNLFGYFHSEITAGTANTFTVYGSSHTYMPLGNTATHGVSGRVSNSSVCLMMRWE